MIHLKKLFLASILLSVLISFTLINLVGASSEMWSKTYGNGKETGHSLVETSDEAFALAGFKTSTYAGPPDLWLIKADKYGNIPEFPSWIILPLLIIAPLIVLIFKKKVFCIIQD